MRHEKIKELLPLYLDNDLTEQEKRMLEDHLQKCKKCREALKQYQANQALLSSLEKEKAPADFAESTINRINKITKNEKSVKMNENTLLRKIKDYFVFPVRIPAGIIGLAAAVLLITITVLPVVLFNNNPLDNKFQTGDESDYQPLEYKQYSQYSPDTQSVPDTSKKMRESLPEQNSRLLSEPSGAEYEQKIIKRANLVIELKDIDNIDENIMNLAKEYSGYIASSRSWLNQDNRKYHSFELRIPAESFTRVMEVLSAKEYGKLISRSISSQDVTEEYMDLNIRLKNLVSQEERYRQLLDQAAAVEDILKIENELNRIRTEIESLEGRQKYLDNQINYSTISVEFHQPEPIGSGNPDIFRALKNALNKMVDQFYRIIIITGTVIPYLLLFAAGYLLYRKHHHHS